MSDPTGPWQIAPGYQPGLIGRVVQMHGQYYVAGGHFGPDFEAKVAAGLAEFAPRLEAPENQIWSVLLNGRIEASLTIDAQDLGKNRAHLRWFIASDALRSLGAGKALMQTAMDHCDTQAFGETWLWTYAGLDAARALYERYGFILQEQSDGDQWGRVVNEQIWVRPRGG